MLTAIAADLVAWLRPLALPNTLRCEPKKLRYRVLHVPARIPATADDDDG